MSESLLLEMGVKSAAMVSATLLLLRALNGRPAAERSFMAHVGLVAVLLLPLLSLLAPPLELELLAAEPAAPLVMTQIAAPVNVSAAAEAAPLISVAEFILVSYALIAALLGSALVLALVRLRALRRGSVAVVDPLWLAALSQVSQANGAMRRPELRVSGAISSPISWGLLRPVIVLDRGTIAAPRLAEPVLLHELAHIRSLDWLMLVLERLATALFWFNPLVWVLAHQSRGIRERAADDAVLRGQVRPADYALLLVDTARREIRPAPLLANGIAPQTGALEERIIKVLDKHLDRRPLGKTAMASGFALALAIHAPVAAMRLTSAPAPAAPVAAAPAEAAKLSVPAIAPAAAVPIVAQAAASAAAQPAQTRTRFSGRMMDQDGMIVEHDSATGRTVRRRATAAERAEFARARAEIDRARPQIEAARRAIERARPQIEAARAQMERARPQMEAARAQMERIRPQLEAARAEMERARPQMEAARAQMERARPQLEAARAEIERARPQIEAARARAQQIRDAHARGVPLQSLARPGEKIEVQADGSIMIQSDD